MGYFKEADGTIIKTGIDKKPGMKLDVISYKNVAEVFGVQKNT